MKGKTDGQTDGIKVRDLLVGESEAMQMASATWGYLRTIDRAYLRSLIDRLERDDLKSSRLSLPIFKMILFFVEYLEDYTKKNPELNKALEEAREKSEREEFMQGVVL